MRHFPIVAIVIVSACLGPGATLTADPKRMIPPAVPLVSAWTRTFEATVAPISAAASEAGALLVGFPDRVDAFSLTTGDQAWSMPFPSPFLSCAATICLSGEGAEVRALSLQSPRPLVAWRALLPAPLAFAPVQRAGWVFLSTTKGDLIALGDRDGQKIWGATAAAPFAAAPSIDGDRLVVATMDHRLIMFDLRSGRQLWTRTMEAPLGAPRLAGGRVFVGTTTGKLLAVDASDGDVVYSARTLGMVTGAPAIDETLVYTAGQDGVLRAFDRGNGAQRWFANLETRPTSGIIADENLVVVPLRTGAFRLFLPDARPAGRLPPPREVEGDVRLSTAPIIIGHGESLVLIVLIDDLLGWTASVARAAATLPIGGMPPPAATAAPPPVVASEPAPAGTPPAPPVVTLPPGPFPGTLIALTTPPR